MIFLLLLLFAQAPTPQALFEQGRYAEAAAVLENETAPPSRYLLGLCYQQLGDLGKAEAVFARLISTEPKWATGYYALARVLFAEGKFPEAIRAAEAAEKRGEPKARTRRLIGGIEEERGNWAAALAAYDAAAESSESQSGRASVLFKLGRMPEAKTAAERATRLNPGNEDARRLLLRISSAAVPADAPVTPVAFERHPLPFVLNHNPTRGGGQLLSRSLPSAGILLPCSNSFCSSLNGFYVLRRAMLVSSIVTRNGVHSIQDTLAPPCSRGQSSSAG
ncbi:MAG: hypothetical protein JWN34_3938 [Bryobacterales bacterium]|nr:hypothetical protein [Bryobacterales bacterium]